MRVFPDLGGTENNTRQGFKLTSTIRVFTNIEEMLNIREQLNVLVHSQCENPYLLFSFVEQYFQSKVREGEKPFFLVYFVGKRIVGIAPFAVRSWKRLFRVASFLMSHEFDLDFVVQEEYREDFLYKTVNFLFREVGCNLIDISLPSKTQNLQALRRTSKSLGISLLKRPIPGHSVIFVDGSWTEFEKEMGRNFRKFFRRLERRMKNLGKWKVVLATKGDSEAKIFQDISDIEKLSWKEAYRAKMGVERDWLLLDLWKSAINSDCEAEFRWQIAFLEINGRKIAYSFWFEYKNKGIICKTSFDNNYRKHYPGIYVNNAVICEMFKNPAIKQIDLMTDLPFHYRWKPLLIPRFKLTMSKSLFALVFEAVWNRGYLRARSIIRGFISRV